MKPSTPPAPVSFACPICAHPTRVTATKTREGGRLIRRHRRCLHAHCGVRFVTVEMLGVRLAELGGPGPGHS